MDTLIYSHVVLIARKKPHKKFRILDQFPYLMDP